MKKLLLTFILTLTTFLQASNTPPFTLTTIDDKEITINEIKISNTETGLVFEEFKGKAVLLSLFGHRCPPCIKEIPEFISITNKHKKNLEIVAIESQGSSSNEVKIFANDYKMNYNVVAGVNHNDFISYIGGMAGYSRGIPLPLLIAINKNGEVELVRPGLIRKDELEMLVEDLND